jgi:predicted nucleic acid-binding protein
MRIALDTNFVAYLENVVRGPTDHERSAAAAALHGRLARDPAVSLHVCAQMLAELYGLLVRRGGLSRAEAAARIGRYRASHVVTATTDTLLGTAITIATDHQMQIFDAIILAAATDAGCALLLSEDMHNGFIWRCTRVANPFAAGFSLRA